MKTVLCWLLAFIFPYAALAATRNISSGASFSTIQSTIQGASSGDIVVFAAGSYNITCAGITIPNGVTVTGPTIAMTSSGIGNPTAILNNTGGKCGDNSWPFNYNAGSTPASFQYLAWNGGWPQPDGGGMLYVNNGTNNYTVQYNTFIGNQGSTTDGGAFADTFVWFDGSAPGGVDSNDAIQWNKFGGNSNDCSNLMTIYSYQGAGYDANGGQCAGVGIHTMTTNLLIQYNVFMQQEQGMKLYEGGGTGGTSNDQYFIVNTIIRNNDFCCWHRIGVEAQQTPNGGNGDQTGENYYYNTVHDQYQNPAYGSWAFSMPQWDWYTLNIPRNTSLYDNLMVGNVPPLSGNYIPGAFEWTTNNGQNLNNTLQGYWACDVQVNTNPNAQSGIVPTQSQASNNVWQAFSGCFIDNNYSQPNHGPGIQNNNQTSTVTNSYQSAAPTISPTPTGSYSSPITVTLSDTGATNGGIGVQGNTTIYYTTDGSTPTVTSSHYCNANTSVASPTNSCTITVTPGTTVKALGMWGSINQPKSYPTNYGFTPSGVVSAFYPSGGSTPTLVTFSLSLSGGSVTVGSSAQIVATCGYSNSTTDNCTTVDAFGNVASAWTSSNTTSATITSAGVLTGRAAGSTNITAQAGGITAVPLPVTIMAAAPTLTGVIITDGGVATLSVGQTVQASATAQYNGGSSITTNCSGTADIYGTVCNTYTSSTPSIATISTSGLITGVAVGSAAMTVKAVNGSLSFTSNPINLTITSATPPSATLTGVSITFGGQTSVPVGNTIAGAATCSYSDGTTTNCTNTDAHGTLAGSWASSATGVATINSTTGIATGVSNGVTNITVHAGSFTSPAFALQVTPVTANNILGNNQVDFNIQTFPNAFVATYAISPNTASQVSFLNFNLPSTDPSGNPITYPKGGHMDVILVLAPTPTTMASTAICSTTYTFLGTTADYGWHQLGPSGSGCGVISSTTGYWVGTVTDSAGPIGYGGWDCGSSCNTTVPLFGNGTYHFWFNSANYGIYSSMPTSMKDPTGGGTSYQASAYATLTTPTPTLTGGFLVTSGNVNTLVIAGTVQMSAFCSYSDGTSFLCSPTSDQYGNTATAFTSTAPSVATIGAIGSSHPGLVTAISAGTSNMSATLTGGVSTSPYTFTISSGSTGPGPSSGGKKKHK